MRRSHRKGFAERFLLRLALQRPFRCKNCGRRYYGYAFGRRDPHPIDIDDEPALEPTAPPEDQPASETKRRPRGAVPGMKCQSCGSVNVHRSRRRERWERLNQLRLVRRFRCHDCNAPIHAFLPRIWLRGWFKKD